MTILATKKCIFIIKYSVCQPIPKLKHNLWVTIIDNSNTRQRHTSNISLNFFLATIISRFEMYPFYRKVSRIFFSEFCDRCPQKIRLVSKDNQFKVCRDWSKKEKKLEMKKDLLLLQSAHDIALTIVYVVYS